MLQFCCGTDDCTAAGAGKVRRSAKVGGRHGWSELLDLDAASAGLYSLTLRDANGTEITPAQIGSPKVSTKRQPLVVPSPRGLKSKRSCEPNSWKADEGRAEYSRPADGTQILLRSIRGPGQFQITETRSQSFTTSLNIGFADILSLGVGFEVTETVEDSSAYTFTVGEGQTGDVGFTPYLLCTSGVYYLLFP
jgi:hypothetical protein